MHRSLLAALALTTAVSATAQLEIRGFGGINIVELTHGSSNTNLLDSIIHQTSYTGNMGAQAGVAVAFGERLYVQPALYWSKISTQVTNTSTVDGNKLVHEPSVSVLSVPLKVGFRLLPTMADRVVDVRLFGGITGHHVMSVNNAGDPGFELKDEDFKNLFMGADFGLGVDVLFLFLDAGYEFGITPLLADPQNPTRYSMFYTNLGVRFKF